MTTILEASTGRPGEFKIKLSDIGPVKQSRNHYV
uniref:Uncharacterized protein n=1 Tax=Anguilla anguilla TaxID=7936 RepID=A0A0E9TH33_ANGAN